jgi:hypothetical protein
MKGKLVVLSLLLLTLAIFLHAQETEKSRGGIFQLGLGYAIPMYPSPLDEDVTTLQDQPGITRIPLYLNISGGWAISQNTYLTVGVSGFGDRLSASDTDWMQINTILFALKIKYYPFVTGLVVEIGGGFSVINLQDATGSSIRSPYGAGGSVSIAYDFASQPTDGGFQIGIDGMVNYIDSDYYKGIGLFVLYAWK